MKKILIFFVPVAIVLAGGVFWYAKSGWDNNFTSSKSEALYLCNEGKTIKATVSKNEAKVELSDGRNLILPKTATDFGSRYADAENKVAFWYEGNGALILEENQSQTYIGCVKLAADPGILPVAYADGQNGFSIRYPDGYAVNSDYKYEALGPGKDIYGIKFVIPQSYREGRNLSQDTGISVETIPAAESCSADLFLDSVQAQDVKLGDRTYSFASSDEGAAGNRYEEQVWAVKGTNPCMAVRYFIHSTNIGNYPEGTVLEFDKDALIGEFDAIRDSLITM